MSLPDQSLDEMLISGDPPEHKRNSQPEHKTRGLYAPRDIKNLVDQVVGFILCHEKLMPLPAHDANRTAISYVQRGIMTAFRDFNMMVEFFPHKEIQEFEREARKTLGMRLRTGQYFLRLLMAPYWLSDPSLQHLLEPVLRGGDTNEKAEAMGMAMFYAGLINGRDDHWFTPLNAYAQNSDMKPAYKLAKALFLYEDDNLGALTAYLASIDGTADFRDYWNSVRSIISSLYAHSNPAVNDQILNHYAHELMAANPANSWKNAQGDPTQVTFGIAAETNDNWEFDNNPAHWLYGFVSWYVQALYQKPTFQGAVRETIQVPLVQMRAEAPCADDGYDDPSMWVGGDDDDDPDNVPIVSVPGPGQGDSDSEYDSGSDEKGSKDGTDDYNPALPPGGALGPININQGPGDFGPTGPAPPPGRTPSSFQIKQPVPPPDKPYIPRGQRVEGPSDTVNGSAAYRGLSRFWNNIPPKPVYAGCIPKGYLDPFAPAGQMTISSANGSNTGSLSRMMAEATKQAQYQQRPPAMTLPPPPLPPPPAPAPVAPTPAPVAPLPPTGSGHKRRHSHHHHRPHSKKISRRDLLKQLKRVSKKARR